jgi:hypothetical protein
MLDRGIIQVLHTYFVLGLLSQRKKELFYYQNVYFIRKWCAATVNNQTEHCESVLWFYVLR